VLITNATFSTGDEIGSPDGDAYEVYRILFDLTFFFFVIVILLAIIQGESSLYHIQKKGSLIFFP